VGDRDEVALVPVDPASQAARAALTSYFDELTERFPGGFYAGTALAEAAEMLAPPNGLLLLASLDGRTVGCGGLQLLGEATAEVKRMWVSREHRRLGLGRLLLARLEVEATRLGCNRVLLDTNGALAEAASLYRSAGYEEIDRYNENPYAERWFAKWLRPPQGSLRSEPPPR
jgi:GNAT superfamily N-acetyltransferase